MYGNTFTENNITIRDVFVYAIESLEPVSPDDDPYKVLQKFPAAQMLVFKKQDLVHSMSCIADPANDVLTVAFVAGAGFQANFKIRAGLEMFEVDNKFYRRLSYTDVDGGKRRRGMSIRRKNHLVYFIIRTEILEGDKTIHKLLSKAL